MPYIKDDVRQILDLKINELSDAIVETSKTNVDFAGLLNYSFTRVIARLLQQKFGKIRYWHSPMIRGVLQDVGEEFYRRVMSPYEDKQIKNNGDVEEYVWYDIDLNR